MKKRTLGIVYVRGEYIHNTPDTIAKVFAKLQALPVRVDWRIDTDIYEYLLYSPFFKEVELGRKSPEYEIMVTTKLDDNAHVADFEVEVYERPTYTSALPRSATLDYLVQTLSQEPQP